MIFPTIFWVYIQRIHDSANRLVLPFLSACSTASRVLSCIFSPHLLRRGLHLRPFLRAFASLSLRNISLLSYTRARFSRRFTLCLSNNWIRVISAIAREGKEEVGALAQHSGRMFRTWERKKSKRRREHIKHNGGHEESAPVLFLRYRAAIRLDGSAVRRVDCEKLPFDFET